MALNLPNSPAVNSVYTTPDGSQYKWDGVKWIAASIYVTISDVAPSSASAAPGSLWWDSVQGDLYILFSDGDSVQWVPASSSDGLGGLYLPLLGGTLTGPLLLAANPTQALEAATKSYIDARTPPTPKYSVSFSYTAGVLAANQLIGMHRFSRAVYFATDFGDYAGHSSYAGGTVNATASTIIRIQKSSLASPNSFSDVGAITFAAGTVTPTFNIGPSVPLNLLKGDTIRLLGPATPDATFANFYCTLVASEV